MIIARGRARSLTKTPAPTIREVCLVGSRSRRYVHIIVPGEMKTPDRGADRMGRGRARPGQSDGSPGLES